VAAPINKVFALPGKLISAGKGWISSCIFDVVVEFDPFHLIVPSFYRQVDGNVCGTGVC
jgi:hypothetical protein